MSKFFFTICYLLVTTFLPGQCFLTFQLKSNTGNELENPVIELTSSSEHLVFEGTETRMGPVRCNSLFKLKAKADFHKDIAMDLLFDKDQIMVLTLEKDEFLLDPVNITANWAPGKSPLAYTQISGAELSKKNSGKDLPILLESTPSLITTSDAGNGVGYTGLRIRGSDQTRVNVTINGVPVNEVESHNVFWVDLPDLASSVDEIQIQRGVGTSTYGSGSFGGNISIITSRPQRDAYARFDISTGSFNTNKQSIRFGSGLISDKWTFEGRASNITSDGYIDRAKSSLQSLFLNANYIGKKSVLRVIGFSGKEETYQSWYGTPESKYKENKQGILDYAERNGLTPDQKTNLLNSGRTYNFYQYKNQIDHYGQDYIQLIHSYDLSNIWHLSTVLHYTRGKGYYEELKENDAFSNYGLSDVINQSDTIKKANIIRRRWLSTEYYGGNVTLKKETSNLLWLTGVGILNYKGAHFGNIVWIDQYPGLSPDYEYYYNLGKQKELNFFSKVQYQLTERINVFGDLQIRYLNYKAAGIDNDRLLINLDKCYTIFNPKAGTSIDLGNTYSLQASIGAAGAEPLREDFLQPTGNKNPKPESMIDLEIGIKKLETDYNLGLNFYRMQYKDQLVQTGQLNDVGAPIRTNVPDSYRMGVELEFGVKLASFISWRGNLSLSQNKINDFDYILYDYQNGGTLVENIKNTDISYSPSVVGFSDITLSFGKFNINLISKYVGSQYLDNTQNDSRKLDAYFVQDFHLSWTGKLGFSKSIELGFHGYNILNTKYANNAYTYSYLYGSLITENFYYPQAGINFLLSCSIRW